MVGRDRRAASAAPGLPRCVAAVGGELAVLDGLVGAVDAAVGKRTDAAVGPIIIVNLRV